MQITIIKDLNNQPIEVTASTENTLLLSLSLVNLLQHTLLIWGMATTQQITGPIHASSKAI